VKKKGIIIGVILALVLGGAFVYRFTTDDRQGRRARREEGSGEHKEEGKEEKHGEHEEAKSVKMDPETQQKSGVMVGIARKKSLGGAITVTGKVEVNADRIAHVSPRISQDRFGGGKPR